MAVGCTGCTVGIAASAAAALAYSSCKLQTKVSGLREDIATLRSELQQIKPIVETSARTHSDDASASTPKAVPEQELGAAAEEDEFNDVLDDLNLRMPTLWPAHQEDDYVDGEPVLEETPRETPRAADMCNFPSLLRERDVLCQTFHGAALAHSEAEMLAARSKLGSPRDAFSLPGLSSSSTSFVRDSSSRSLSQEEELHLLRSQVHQAVSRRDLLTLRRALDHALAYGMEASCLASELAYCEELAKQREGKAADLQVAEALQSKQYSRALELVIDCSLADRANATSIRKVLATQLSRLTKSSGVSSDFQEPFLDYEEAIPGRQTLPPATTTWGGARHPVRLGSLAQLSEPIGTPRGPQSSEPSRTPRGPALSYRSSLSQSPRNASRGIPPPPSQHVPPPIAPASGDIEESPAFGTVAPEGSEVFDSMKSREKSAPRMVKLKRSPRVGEMTEPRENTVTLAPDDEHENIREHGGMSKLHSSAPHAAMFAVRNLGEDDHYRPAGDLHELRVPIGAAHEGRANTEPAYGGASFAPLARVPPRSPGIDRWNRSTLPEGCMRVEWS